MSLSRCEPDEASPTDRGLPIAEPDAIQHLQQVHGPVLLGYLTRITRGDVHRAEDILQETLVRAWRTPEAKTHNGRWSRAWLFTVARRIAIDGMRSAKVRPAELPDDRIDAHAVADDHIQRLVDAHEVRAALASLPEKLRTTLVEVYFHECSVMETANRLGVPPGTVKSRTHYGLQALREALVYRGFLDTSEEAASSEKCMPGGLGRA